jgi:hypothetical protein
VPPEVSCPFRNWLATQTGKKQYMEPVPQASATNSHCQQATPEYITQIRAYSDQAPPDQDVSGSEDLALVRALCCPG